MLPFPEPVAPYHQDNSLCSAFVTKVCEIPRSDVSQDFDGILSESDF